MPKFNVTIEERAADGRVNIINQTAVCQNRQQIIDFYGLEEADVISYTIEEEQ